MDQRETAFIYYERLHKLSRHFDEHLSEDISLDTAASLVGLEKTYFSKFFHEKTGICFKDWVASRRVDRATELLRLKDYNLTQLAFDVGFRSIRTFERAFKKWTGSTPASFKKAVQPRC